MKVALLNNCPHTTGMGVYAFSLFNVIQSYEGIEARMICTHPSNVKRVTNDEIIFLSKVPWATCSQLLTYFINPLRMPKIYDLFHVTTQLLGRFAKFNHPCIVTVHDVFAFKTSITSPLVYKNSIVSTMFNMFIRNALKDILYADAIICPSQFTKGELIKTLKVKAQKIKVILNGTDHNRFKLRDKIIARKKLKLPFR